MKFEQVRFWVIVSDGYLYAKPNSLGCDRRDSRYVQVYTVFKSPFVIAVGTLMWGKSEVTAVVALSFRNARGG